MALALLTTQKTCIHCGVAQDLSQFPKDRRASDGHFGSCKSCESKRSCRWAAANPARVRTFRTYQYNIDFNSMWEAQRGLCAMCHGPMLPRGKDPASVVVDHDRSCCSSGTSCGGCVRGLIHNRCNRVLGNARDDTTLLRFAADYLDRWRGGKP